MDPLLGIGALSPTSSAADKERQRDAVDVVVPAHNEEALLESSVEQLVELSVNWNVKPRIIVVDSASADRTWEHARRLARRWPRVETFRMELPGRGRALRAAWCGSAADVLAYSDADLSADPKMLETLVGMVVDGADLVVASRLASGAVVDRGAKRELLSRGYSMVLAWLVGPPFRDAQCGLKAGRGAVVRDLLPLVEDDQWFFDSELLLLAWSRGFSVVEVPVRWTERIESTVDVRRAALANLTGLARMTRERLLRDSGDPLRVMFSGARRAGGSLVGSVAASLLVGTASQGRRRHTAAALLGLGILSVWRRRRGLGRDVRIGFVVDDGVAAGLAASTFLLSRSRRSCVALVGVHVGVTCLHLFCLGVWDPVAQRSSRVIDRPVDRVVP